MDQKMTNDNILDKQTLLEINTKSNLRENNITFKDLVIVILGMLILLLVFLLKIAITNKIYYVSKDISKINSKIEVLKEENRELNSTLQMIKFKNQILNPLSIP